MNKRLALLLIVLMTLTSVSATPVYDKGSQLLSFKFGTTVPTFTYFFSDSNFVVGPGQGNTGAKVGGYGAISYQVFNTDKTAIGGEIGYNFNYSAANLLFTAVPFYAKYSYFPVQGSWDIPLSVGLGGAYIKYNDAALMTLYTNLEVGVTWYPGTNWGFGFNTGLWLIPEFNYKEDLKQDNAIGGFMPITLSIIYRQ